MVQTHRNNTRRRSHTPRREQRDHRNAGKTEEISRHLIRLLRHKPKRHEAHFPVELSTGASISLGGVLRHTTFSEYDITEGELDVLASVSEPTKKLRFDA